MTSPWHELADAVVASVRERVGAFLDDHVDAKALVLERADRLGKLAWEYAAAAEADRPALAASMEVVRQTIENEAANVALGAGTAAKDAFREAVSAVFGVLVKALPAVLGML